MRSETIKFTSLLFVCLCGAMPFVTSAAVDANPYHLICQRNSFRLLPLVDLPIETPRPPPAKIWLQGITTVLGRPLALLRLTSPVNGPEVSVILGKGERIACVEVIEIDGTTRTVQLLNCGATQELSLRADARVPLASHQQLQLGSATVISIQRPAIYTPQKP